MIKQNTILPRRNQATFRQILELKSALIRLSGKEEQELRRLQKGFEGEEVVADFLKNYGHPGWKILRNVLLNEESPFEVDVLVIGEMGLLALEVKNYEGDFTYDNGSCYYEKTQMTRDIVAQTRRIHLKLEQLAQRMRLVCNVNTALVFINEHNEITFNQQPDSIDIVKRNELKNYIEQAVHWERSRYSHSSIADQLRMLEKAAL